MKMKKDITFPFIFNGKAIQCYKTRKNKAWDLKRKIVINKNTVVSVEN